MTKLDDESRHRVYLAVRAVTEEMVRIGGPSAAIERCEIEREGCWFTLTIICEWRDDNGYVRFAQEKIRKENEEAP